MKELLNSRYAFLTFPLIAFIFLLIYSPSTSPLYLYEGFDSCTFKTIGLGILDGKMPFTDLFDHKGPILFWLNALGLSIIPGRIGLFLLETIFFSVTLFFTYKAAALYTDKGKAFTAMLLTLIPAADFITEGNQCEEYMLPFIACSIYLALRYTTGRIKHHPLKYSLFYGLSCGIIFFIRPNDAVSHSGAIMAGIFLIQLHRKEYRTAIANAIVFILGFIAITISVTAYFYAKGSLYDMLHGTILYNMQYASDSGLNEGSIGILVIPIIIYGGSIFLSRKDDKSSWFIFIPNLILTLILIGKRDYYHYLLPVLPMTCVFLTRCLAGGYRKTAATVCILFAIFSFRQHLMLIRCINNHDKMSYMYQQTRLLIENVPDTARNNIWNHNLYKLPSDKSPHIYSMTGIWTNAGISPANRVFIPFHRNRFGDEATLATNKPKWVLALKEESNSAEATFLHENYNKVASTAEDCIAQLTLYKIRTE